jgi:Rod binding domain-containing protein
VQMNSGFDGANLQATILQSGADRLIQSTKPSQLSNDAEIEKGAKQFEAVLVGSWLQQAEQFFATLPGTDEDQDVGRDQMMSFGVQSLATSIADGGGIGIGSMVAKAMHALAGKQDSTAANVDGGHAR